MRAHSHRDTPLRSWTCPTSRWLRLCSVSASVLLTSAHPSYQSQKSCAATAGNCFNSGRAGPELAPYINTAKTGPLSENKKCCLTSYICHVAIPLINGDLSQPLSSESRIYALSRPRIGHARQALMRSNLGRTPGPRGPGPGPGVSGATMSVVDPSGRLGLHRSWAPPRYIRQTGIG